MKVRHESVPTRSSMKEEARGRLVQYVEGLSGETPIVIAYSSLRQKRHESCAREVFIGLSRRVAQQDQRDPG